MLMPPHHQNSLIGFVPDQPSRTLLERQQRLRATQRLLQQQRQWLRLQHLACGFLQRLHAHRVVHGQVRIQWLAQLVLHQTVVQATVNPRTLLDQFDAALAVDGVLGDHRAALSHVRHYAKVVRTILHTVADFKQWVCDGKPLRSLATL